MKKKLLIAGVILLVAGLGFASAQFVGQDFHVIGEIEIHDGDQGNWNDDIADEATILDTADVAQDVTWTFPDATSGAVTVGDFAVAICTGPLATGSVDTMGFIADRAYTVTDMDAVWATAESAGTVGIMPERLQGTEAIAAGDDLLTTAFDGTATANTVVSGTLTATAANLNLAAGDRIGLDFSGDVPGELLNVCVTIGLVPN